MIGERITRLGPFGVGLARTELLEGREGQFTDVALGGYVERYSAVVGNAAGGVSIVAQARSTHRFVHARIFGRVN